MPKKLKEKIEEISLLGAENELRLPHIELCSNREANVEGCVGIIEYDENVVRLNCKNITVKFSGDRLSIGNLSGGFISVSGEIVAVEFGN